MESVKPRIRFVIVVIIAHTIAYLFSGGIAYQFITKPLWEGSDSLLASYLRTPGNEELWGFAMIWQIPGQVLRSLLMGLVFLPLFSSLKTWTFFKKSCS
ncbi:MAG: hypothetical protein IPO32_17515 [Crocinitomicaceae bacterium]|nr:hypothetical protein [Crocinitomicaceae bacterium]